MAEDYGICGLCKKGKLIKKGDREVGGNTYIMLRCDKCGHQIARSIR